MDGLLRIVVLLVLLLTRLVVLMGVVTFLISLIVRRVLTGEGDPALGFAADLVTEIRAAERKRKKNWSHCTYSRKCSKVRG